MRSFAFALVLEALLVVALLALYLQPLVRLARTLGGQ